MFNIFRKKPPEPQPLKYTCPDGQNNERLQTLLTVLTPEEQTQFNKIAAGTRNDSLGIIYGLGPDNLRRAINLAFGEKEGPYVSVIGEPEKPLESAA